MGDFASLGRPNSLANLERNVLVLFIISQVTHGQFPDKIGSDLASSLEVHSQMLNLLGKHAENGKSCHSLTSEQF
jgi:hypothetical protein